MKHVRIPKLNNYEGLEWGDLLIFANIYKCRDYMTNEAWPKVETLAHRTKYSIDKIWAGLKRLKSLNLLQIEEKEDKLIFKCALTNEFEKFSFDFIEMKLKPDLKEYIIRLQPFLYYKGDAHAINFNDDFDTARKLNTTQDKISEMNSDLEKLGFLTTTAKGKIKHFDMVLLNQFQVLSNEKLESYEKTIKKSKDGEIIEIKSTIKIKN